MTTVPGPLVTLISHMSCPRFLTFGVQVTTGPSGGGGGIEGVRSTQPLVAAGVWEGGGAPTGLYPPPPPPTPLPYSPCGVSMNYTPPIIPTPLAFIQQQVTQRPVLEEEGDHEGSHAQWHRGSQRWDGQPGVAKRLASGW